ncbi:hypothetical protein F8M41_016502 [Gigaspora margarita]|uniref:Uncharacterized protein n=1 Tax=Gigaspora margarita TaxID=4874 RepID=A0A8H3WWY1_GIGMA|nr:hypothetical protein F8M41_016502 [Gigaspora margarita]
MSKYLSTAKDVPVFGKSAESFCKSSLFDKLPQDDHFDINENQLDFGYSSKISKKILFKDINFSNSVQNINLENYIVNLSNNNDLFENLADMFFELEDNTYSKNLNADYFEDIQNNSSDDKKQEYNEFPNKAYTDLIVLVTKYKLSNAARNAIISFFNKHSNYSKSLLPKNIKQEKLFMNKGAARNQLIRFWPKF